MKFSMRHLAFAMAALLSAAPANSIAQPQGNSAVASLDAFKDHSRPLLVFYRRPEPGRKEAFALLTMQLSMLQAHAKELKERDVPMVLIPARPGDALHFTQDDEAALRRRFAVGADDFTVVLIGKDGEEKLRSHTPVTIERLTALIDSMPMRQQEVRDGHPK
jgi:hypothetical protein